MRQRLGTVITGSLADGFQVRLEQHVPPEQLKTGHFVVLAGQQYRFFSLVTDLKLEVANPEILLAPPQAQETLLQAVLCQQDIFLTAQIKPVIMLDQQQRLAPVKTIPPHFAPVYAASDQDVALIFGAENQHPKYFAIGRPLDMTASVCLDLERLVERSNGIFGKTGTGKTFITRLILAGVMQKQKAVNLIFDMHSEYGLQARTETAGSSFVRGLKSLFPERVAIFTLDPASTRRRGGAPDVTVSIAYQDIKVEDIMALQAELNLHSTALESAYLLAAKYKQQWLVELLRVGGEQAKELAQEVGAHPESIAALYRKLRKIEQLPFFSATPTATQPVIEELLAYLSRGISVVIEFGNY
ncbi:MAG TPA: ATP-binding protein, partial [Candidatus Babeliales bacterium]|nr:ATP-binding protein [Candidatus Babeliales bacterium]